MAGTSELLGPVLTLSDSTNKDGKIILNGKEVILGRNIGEIVFSALPITTDAGLIQISVAQNPLAYGAYKDFIDYIDSIYSTYPSLFVTDAQWTEIYNEFGACGKFVYNSTNHTVRLPVINNFIEGATSISELGAMTEAGVPDIWGGIGQITYVTANKNYGAFSESTVRSGVANGSWASTKDVIFHASDGEIHNVNGSNTYRNDVYGKSDTVQPQSVKLYVYLVVANASKSSYQIDVDEVMADVNSLRTDVANTKRNIGELVFSSIPLVDAGLKLANGQALTIGGTYANFCNYMLDLYNAASPCITTGTEPVKGKYVYDSANTRIFLPILEDLFIEGTATANELGKFESAGLPNLDGKFGGSNYSWSTDGVLFGGDSLTNAVRNYVSFSDGTYSNAVRFNASSYNSIYGNSDTVQPPAVKQYIYIVVATSIKPDYVADVDKIMAEIDAINNTKVTAVNLPQSSFTWNSSNGGYFTRAWTPPDGYTVVGFTGYFTNATALFSVAYRTDYSNPGILVFGKANSGLGAMTSDYAFVLYALLVKS